MPSTDTTPTNWRTREVAKWLRVDRHTVYRLCVEGAFPGARKLDGSHDWVIPEADLEDMRHWRPLLRTNAWFPFALANCERCQRVTAFLLPWDPQDVTTPMVCPRCHPLWPLSQPPALPDAGRWGADA